MNRRRQTVAVVSALGVIAASTGQALRSPTQAPDARPNIIVILSDDQTLETLPHDPPIMPWLQSQMESSTSRWRWFPNAVFNTPLCCPSRASILTGQYSHHTGVVNNDTGHLLDETNTLPVWLHDAGYTTGLVGKYLNKYPFDRGNNVPPGWDRWFAKLNESGDTTYYGYHVIDQGVPRTFGTGPSGYVMSVLTQRATDFLRAAPESKPFFLYFAPPAPHLPWVAAPGDIGAYQGPMSVPASVTAPVRGKPPWVHSLPAVTPEAVVALQEERRMQYDTLLGLDRSVHALVDAVAARGSLSNTYIFFLTDNGYSFGEQRIIGKRCPYEACIRTPFLVYAPEANGRTDPRLVSNVDIAPTIAALASLVPGAPEDGSSFAADLTGSPGRSLGAAQLIEWAGDPEVPPWWGVRTLDFAYIETGTWVELYDLTGKRGPPDPGELHNVADLPEYAGVRARLAARLRMLRAEPPA